MKVSAREIRFILSFEINKLVLIARSTNLRPMVGGKLKLTEKVSPVISITAGNCPLGKIFTWSVIFLPYCFTLSGAVWQFLLWPFCLVNSPRLEVREESFF